MTGNPDSGLHSPRFLLDESLTRVVANALRLVGYDIQDVLTVFDPDGTRRAEGIEDPEIIEWCRTTETIWIHADDRARRQHGALIVRRGIRTLLVHRPGGQMTAREQLRLLAFVLPKLLENFETSPGVRHYKVTAANDRATPKLSRVRM